MEQTYQAHSRRAVLAGLAACTASLPLTQRAHAQAIGALLSGSGMIDVLGRASDASLDKLAVPGAFYNDAAVRIALPLLGGAGGALGSLLNGASRLGIADPLVRKLNEAAGLAAKEAKPIFRAAISRLTIADVPGIAAQSDGASQYLRRSAGNDLKGKLRPLVDASLGKVGAFTQLDALARRSALVARAGLSRDALGNSVTDQALNGIFKYIGAEEGRLRANPLGTAGSVLKGVLGN